MSLKHCFMVVHVQSLRQRQVIKNKIRLLQKYTMQTMHIIVFFGKRDEPKYRFHHNNLSVYLCLVE